MQVFTRVRGRSRCVTQRCHNSPDAKRGLQLQMTSRTVSARRILGIFKKRSVSWVELNWVETCIGGRRLAFACSRRPLWLVLHVVGIWRSQDRKNVNLSPYVEEPLNSKVIKIFVPELRSRYVFFEFRDSYVLSLWTFDVRFPRSHIMAMGHLYILHH